MIGTQVTPKDVRQAGHAISSLLEDNRTIDAKGLGDFRQMARTSRGLFIPAAVADELDRERFSKPELTVSLRCSQPITITRGAREVLEETLRGSVRRETKDIYGQTGCFMLDDRHAMVVTTMPAGKGEFCNLNIMYDTQGCKVVGGRYAIGDEQVSIDPKDLAASRDGRGNVEVTYNRALRLGGSMIPFESQTVKFNTEELCSIRDLQGRYLPKDGLLEATWTRVQYLEDWASLGLSQGVEGQVCSSVRTPDTTHRLTLFPFQYHRIGGLSEEDTIGFYQDFRDALCGRGDPSAGFCLELDEVGVPECVFTKDSRQVRFHYHELGPSLGQLITDSEVRERFGKDFLDRREQISDTMVLASLQRDGGTADLMRLGHWTTFQTEEVHIPQESTFKRSYPRDGPEPDKSIAFHTHPYSIGILLFAKLGSILGRVDKVECERRGVTPADFEGLVEHVRLLTNVCMLPSPTDITSAGENATLAVGIQPVDGMDCRPQAPQMTFYVADEKITALAREAERLENLRNSHGGQYNQEYEYSLVKFMSEAVKNAARPRMIQQD